MTKRTGLFDINVDFDVKRLIEGDQKSQQKEMTIEKALTTITKQMQVSGFRERTIKDYNLHMNHLCKITNVTYLHEISSEMIYLWLDSMKVSNQTKLIRLKCLKAILSKCFDNGWVKQRYWKTINIKVDKNVKKGATSSEIQVLLSLLDLNSFIGLRDAVAIITLYKTGIRINTLGQLEERHIDFENMMLNLDGAILKNHKMLQLPIDNQMAQLFRVLIDQNEKIRRRYSQRNKFVFLSQKGTSLNTKSTNNAISKRLNKYSKEYNLVNINPHAIRRGYAKDLLIKGANLALISKALGHSNLAVTTQYLDLDEEEVLTNLRTFL
ncbi:site-specific integrase [Paenisporosarcina sp. FSL H8-0542]|uniref:tyrosine-type recombinase/integrase n=1 Tax=Paenisporosarcina sp. FSL H8-0542 TaxID=2921401 RepID=UPI00315B0F27